MLDTLEQLAAYYVLLVKQDFKSILLASLRKYFVCSIKNVPQVERKNECQIIRAFSCLVAELLCSLVPSNNAMNAKYVEHAFELLNAYNEVFKRVQKMNPWIIITLHGRKAVDALFVYATYFLRECTEE